MLGYPLGRHPLGIPPARRPLQRTVRILLECFLVSPDIILAFASIQFELILIRRQPLQVALMHLNQENQVLKLNLVDTFHN